MQSSPAQNRLVLLGTKGGPAVRRPDAMPTSNLLQLDGKTIVIDCGVGVTRAIVNAGTSLLDIDAVFITHLHSDHLLELGPLLHTMWTSGLKNPVKVFGPVGTDTYIAHFLKSMEFDNRIRVEDEGRTPLGSLIDLQIFGEGDVCKFDGINIDALRVKHPPVDECYALRFDGTKSVVFSADTAFFEPLADFAKGADLLVHEAMLMDGVEVIVQQTPNAERLREHLLASHSTVEEASRIASIAGVGKLVLNHLIPADMGGFSRDDFLREAEKHFSGEILVGFDGMEIQI